MNRQLDFICIGCPMGCEVTVTIDEADNIKKIAGNGCKEGKEYVQSEYKHPVRVLTTTVPVEGSNRRTLPVRTNTPIPKDKLMEAMITLAKVRVNRPFKIGQIIVKNISKTGADVVATDVLSKRDFIDNVSPES